MNLSLAKNKDINKIKKPILYHKEENKKEMVLVFQKKQGRAITIVLLIAKVTIIIKRKI